MENFALYCQFSSIIWHDRISLCRPEKMPLKLLQIYKGNKFIHGWLHLNTWKRTQIFWIFWFQGKLLQEKFWKCWHCDFVMILFIRWLKIYMMIVGLTLLFSNFWYLLDISLHYFSLAHFYRLREKGTKIKKKPRIHSANPWNPQ